MDKLTYEAYRTNPAIRDQIDADVRRLRSEAFRDFVVMPVAGAVMSVIATVMTRMALRSRRANVAFSVETV